MALFKILNNFTSGNTNLPTTAVQGYCYFDKNTGKFWIDTTNDVQDRMALNAYKADYATALETARSITIGAKTLDFDGTQNLIFSLSDIKAAPIDSIIEYIVGTQTSATGAWTGVTQDSELSTGKMIAYKLPAAGSGDASLTLTFTNPTGNTTSAAIPIYAGSTRLTTHYGAGSVLIMVYDGSAWHTNPFYDTNTDITQNITLATTTKAYLTGVNATNTLSTNNPSALEGIADTGVYLTETAGEISAVRHSFNNDGAEKAYITFDATLNALEFAFV